MDVVNSGSINEFTISAGANLNNIVYIGATIGIQSVHKATGVYYGEDYRYDHGQAINSKRSWTTPTSTRNRCSTVRASISNWA